jgi:hypothetical protein
MSFLLHNTAEHRESRSTLVCASAWQRPRGGRLNLPHAVAR